MAGSYINIMKITNGKQFLDKLFPYMPQDIRDSIMVRNNELIFDSDFRDHEKSSEILTKELEKAARAYMLNKGLNGDISIKIQNNEITIKLLTSEEDCEVTESVFLSIAPQVGLNLSSKTKIGDAPAEREFVD